MNLRSFLASKLSLLIRKYSCSGPTEAVTLVASVSGSNNLTILIASLLTASIDLKRGAFLSRVSPVYEQNTVGIQRTAPIAPSLINAGEVTSHTV